MVYSPPNSYTFLQPGTTGHIQAVGATEVLTQRAPRDSAALILCLVGPGTPAQPVPAHPRASARSASLTEH